MNDIQYVETRLTAVRMYHHIFFSSAFTTVLIQIRKIFYCTSITQIFCYKTVPCGGVKMVIISLYYQEFPVILSQNAVLHCGYFQFKSKGILHVHSLCMFVCILQEMNQIEIYQTCIENLTIARYMHSFSHTCIFLLCNHKSEYFHI